MEASYPLSKGKEEEESCPKGQASCLLLYKSPHKWSFSFISSVLDLMGALFFFADISSAFL
jgi:hypothetical protein